jgi:hypothetical protein
MAFPVAVGAANIAFANFVQNCLLGVALADHAADTVALSPTNMIEVKATRITFPTVDARMQ